MRKLQVKIESAFISPLFWRDFNGGKFVLTNNEREILGNKISIEGSPNADVIVFGSWNPYAYLHDEYLLSIEQRKQDQAKEREQSLIAEAERKADAISFNESLNIPVKWSPEIKEVLSGLGASSQGNGYKKNTVIHVFLHEELQTGKLIRKPFTFLCSEPKTAGNWSGALGGQDNFNQKVTCITCLKVVKRFS